MFRSDLLLRTTGTLLILIGAALLGLSATYYAYSLYAQSQLGKLNRSLPTTSQKLASPTIPEAQQYLLRPTKEETNPPLQIEAEAALTSGNGEFEGEPGLAREASTSKSAEGASPPSPLEKSPSYPPFRIAIPSIEVDSKVVHLGITYDEEGQLVWETPAHAVGHYQGTANPGEKGNIVMAGHISSPIKGEGNVFRRLPEVVPGDEVMIYTLEWIYRYRVTETKVVLPTETSVMDPTPEPTLTLITCVPDWVYSHRLIVTAKPF